MDWLGIGVLLIGVALLILAIVLIKPLTKLTEVLKSVQKTTDMLPRTVTNVTEQTTTVMRTSNATIANVNDKISEIGPVFYLVGDIGEASRVIASNTLDKTLAFKTQATEANAIAKRKKYEGIYGLLTLVYVLANNKNELKEQIANIDLK